MLLLRARLRCHDECSCPAPGIHRASLPVVELPIVGHKTVTGYRMSKTHIIRALGVLDLLVVVGHAPKIPLWIGNFSKQPSLIVLLLLLSVILGICAFKHLRVSQGWQLCYYVGLIPRVVFGFLTFMPLLWLFPGDAGASAAYSIAVAICFALEAARGAFTVTVHWRAGAVRVQ